MDPASIVGLVAACSSLTKQCASVVKNLHGLIETYKSAELTILSLITECETIQFAWHSIESWAQEHLHNANGFEELGARFQKSIYCGELVMSAMEEELLMITSKSSSLQRGLGVAWNSSVLMEHQHRIRGQVAALQLLLQVMNLPRKEDRIEVLSVKEKVLVDSDESALSIIPSDRSTRFSLDGNRLSIVSEDGDIKYIRFSFEDALFTSHVYKRNYRFPTKQTQGRGDHRLATHAKDLIGSMPADPNTRSVTDNLVDQDDEDFFQDSMIQLHQDLFSGASSDTNTDHPVSHQHEKSRDSDSIPSVGPTTQQKLLLSRALQKANTAVMLDTAENFESAKQSYEAACKLLEDVAAPFEPLSEDRQKLNNIIERYQLRIAEITELIKADNNKTTFDFDFEFE